jgi:geranylgeranylglycerol-phosphate geranylgeranyltransferase
MFPPLSSDHSQEEAPIEPKSYPVNSTLGEVALLDCVDRGLGIFASDHQREVYWRNELLAKMEENGSKEKNILREPENFQKAIEDTFGLGAWAIERAITKDIRKQFDLESSESRNMVSAIKAVGGKISTEQKEMPRAETFSPSDHSRKHSSLDHVKAFGILARSEYRVTMFVWALVIAYLLATDLKPNSFQLVELVVAWYFLCLGVYVFNALTDVEEDRIDHPRRPMPSGRVSITDGWLVFGISNSIAFVASFLISPICFILILGSFVLGIAYSHPTIRAKRRFPPKMIVSVVGAISVSLCGGIVAGNLNAPVYFSAVFFGLFAMVTLLLGDLSDIPGDTAAGVRSLPVVIGARNSIFVIALIPLVIAFIGVAFFRMANLNPLFPVLIVVIAAYSSINIISLLGKYDDYAFVRQVKSRMRIVHFVIQLSLLVGLLVL